MKKFKIYFFSGIFIWLISSLFFVGKGYFNLTVGEVILGAWRGWGEDPRFVIINTLRIPRILVAAITGGILSLSGVVFQGILFNPLADAYILGVASGAAFGAALAIVLGVGFLGEFTVSFVAFIFALLSLYFVIALSQKKGKINSSSLVLAGVIVSSFFSAGVSFLQFLKGDGVQGIVFWIMGSFAAKTWKDFMVIAPISLISSGIIYYYRKELNLISLGDRIALSSGVDVKKTKKILLLNGALLASVAVSISGVIGFVGLMVPHLVRTVVGSDNSKVIPLSIIYGALLTTVADNLVRIYFPGELPIGIIMAVLGTPFFIVVFRKKIIGSA